MPEKVISVRGGLVVVDLAGPEEWERGEQGETENKKIDIRIFFSDSYNYSSLLAYRGKHSAHLEGKKTGDKLRGKPTENAFFSLGSKKQKLRLTIFDEFCVILPKSKMACLPASVVARSDL